MNEQLLKDFLATAKKDNYNWNAILPKFPELKDYDLQLLKDYAATAKKDNYDYSIINPKFPEFNLEKQEGGEPVNFTEGSGEQQEQPTEPLKKPIVDVDRFSVPETNEYLSGARETAAKELKETEELLISADIPDLPKHVIDYPSYNVEQLDSALTDIDKRKKQTNLTLSTHGLTQPQRTEAKKQIERLEEERAAAIVYKAEKTNDYSLVGDAVEAVGNMGYHSAIGKKLRPEIYKLESRVSEDVFKEIEGLDIYDLTEIDNNGIRRADVEKVSDLADKVAESIADGNPGVRQIAYEKIFDRAENNRFIDESIKRASKNEVIQKIQSDKLSSFQDTNESAIKFKAEASSSAKKINNKTESKLNTLSQDYTKNAQNYFSDLQSEVSQGLMTAEDAQKDYDSYNQELYKNLKEEQNFIVNEAESAIKDINEIYSQKIQKGYEEFSKNNPLSQEERDLLSTEYGKIYEEIRDDEFKKLKGQETLDYIKYGGLGLTFDFGKSLNSTLSRAISGAGTYFGSPSLVEIGDEMNTSFSVADEPLENWSDLANIPAVTKSIGRLAGSAASSIIVGSAVSASTAGLGTVPAMALVAATGFVTESIDMAGNIKRDVIRETGSLLKGEEAAGAMWEAQMGNWWTYLGDGLPFVSKALKFIPSKTGRILTAGGESVATETPQEIFQTSQEQKIMESVRSGEEISAKGFMELITPELAKSTFLEVAPGSLFLGGGSRVITEVRMQGQANQIVKDLIDNINLNGVDKNQSFIKQKIFSSINRHGKNFTNSWLSTLQENGAITEEQLNELYTFSKTAEGFSRNVKNTNLTDEQQQTYFGISHRANELFDQAEAITDDKVLKSSLNEEANKLKKNAQEFLSNPETGGSFVTVKIGKLPSLVLTESEAIDFVTNNPYVAFPEADVTIQGRNVDEFTKIFGQMAQGAEAGLADLKSIDDYGKQQSEEGRLSDVDNTLTKINNADYINDNEIDASIEQIFDEVDRVDGLDISDNAKESIKQQLFSVAEILDNYEFRTKTETRKVTPKESAEGGAEAKREIPKKSTSKAEIPGVGTVNLTFTGRNTISITPKGQEGTAARVTTFTFPENFLYTNEEGDFTALVIEDAEGNQITINDPDIGVPLAINNIIAETAAVSTEVVEEFVTEEINYIKERKEAAPKAKEAAPKAKEAAPVTEAVEKTTDTTTEGVDTTSELSEEQVSELNRILGLDESERKSQRQGRTKIDNQRLDKVGRAIELLKQSLSEVMPNIVIYVAENSDAFAVAANEQKDRKQDRSRGDFRRVNGKYVIILNPDSADVTTVFHEGLHAVLRAAGLPNAQARAVTSRMVEAVKKTATKKLQKELKEFSDLYESRLQSEEYIAELISILANNYNEQNNETKSIIRRWLQKLAEMLGLKPKGVSLSTVGLNNTDAATIDALNFVAKKMSEGGVFTEQDLTRLTQPGEEQQGDGSEETVTRKQKAGMRMDEGQDSVKKQMPQSASKVLYNDSDVLPKPSKKKSNSQVAQDLAEVAAEYYGGNIITSNTITSKQEEEIIQVGTEEAIKAFEDSGKSAADWYSTAIEKAMAVAAVIHPSLSSKEEANKYDIFNKEKDPVKAANLAMRIALAITSQNLNVEANAKYANEQFDILKKTGKFDASREYGTKATSISSNLRLANELINKIGLNQSENFITKDFTTVELEEAASEALGKKVKISGLRNDLVNGAALFGPKIGQGFLQNLMGKFEPVTIDLWLRRTWGRWTGDVVGVGVTEERMARLLNGISEAKKDTGFDIPDFMRKHKVIKKTRPSSGSSYSTMSDSFTNELEDNDEFRNDISIFAKALTAKANTMYKLIKNEPMSKELYRDFMSGKKTYGQTANELQLIKDKTSDKYKDYASKEKAKGLTPIKKSEWVNTQNKKEGRDVFPNNKAISSRKPEWVKASTTIINDLKPIDIPSNQDRKVITRVVKEIKNRMEKQGYSVTNADVQALLWYPEKDIWSKLRGEEESNLKQSYDEQFIKIAEKQGLGKEAKAAAEGIKSRRTTQPGGTDGRTTDVKVSRPVAKKETVTRKQKRQPSKQLAGESDFVEKRKKKAIESFYEGQEDINTKEEDGEFSMEEAEKATQKLLINSLHEYFGDKYFELNGKSVRIADHAQGTIHHSPSDFSFVVNTSFTNTGIDYTIGYYEDIQDAIDIILDRVGDAEETVTRKQKSKGYTKSLTQAQLDKILDKKGISTKTENDRLLQEEGRGNQTQRNNISTFDKFVKGVVDTYGDNVNILDIGAGLGIGAKSAKKYNINNNYSTYEPFPSLSDGKWERYSGTKKPDYTEESKVPKGEADIVVNNAVLNVVPQDTRDGIVRLIGESLAGGGKAYVSVRGIKESALKETIEKAKSGRSKNIWLSDSEYYVTGANGDYQKGFLPEELKNYIQSILGDNYTVEISKEDFWKSSLSAPKVVITKSKETVTRKQKRRTKPKSKVKDAFEFGIQKGVPAIAIKNHLIKLGYTEEEITSGAYDAEKIWNKDGKKVKNWFELARRSALSARKFRPQSMFLAQEAMESSISAELRQAKMMADNLNRAINRYKSQDKRDKLIDAVDEFMRDAEERDFWRNELPDDIAQIAEAMRVHIDSLSLKLVDSGVIKAESSRENILGNIGVYMNRSYQVFDNKNWKEEVSDQVITAAQNHLREAYYNSLSGISELDQQLKDGKITESEYNRRKNRILSNKASVKEIMDRDNVSEDEALTMHVEKVVDDILTRKDVDEYISFAKSVVGKKDLSSLKRRKDIPPAIRALMGEYTDPGYNYAMSIFKIANLVENQKYLTKIRDAGLGVWLFEDEAGIKKREGYKQITFDGDASMNPLDGLYAPEAVADAFNDKELSKIISGIPVIGTPYKTYLKLIGGVKYSKTILSFGTHAKNVIGNMYFMAQNGYLDPREYQQPFMTLVKQFSGKELTAEQEAKMNEWIRAGIIGQGASIGEIKAIFEGEDSFEKALSKRIDKKTDNILSKGVKVKNWVGKKAQEAYQYEDDMFKIVAYEKEKLNYSKILFDGKSYNKLDAAQQSTVNNYVAEIIKNILPNYGRIGGFGKFLKAVPVAGTFISFQLEAYRTAYNTVALAIQEIKGDIPGVSEAGKKLAQKRGAMRLASIVGFQAFKYGIIALLGVPLIPGDDDDEDGLSEKIRMLLPFWDTNSDIAIQDVKPNGNFTYVSISASDPYGSIFKVVNATRNYTKTGEGFSKIFGELAGPFVSEDILLNTLRNVSNNENDYGGKIWRKTDTEFEVSKKISFELYKAFEPGSITSTRKIFQSENKLNDIIGQFTGFKVHEIKSLEQAGFKFRDIQNEAQESKKAYNSVKYNIDDYETQSDIDKVIRTSKKSMDKDYQEAVKLYQALTSLGVSDRDIKKKMYDSGISATMRSQISRNSVDVKLNPIKK